MKKFTWLAMGLVMTFGVGMLAQDEAPAKEKPAEKKAEPAVVNPCKNKIQIKDLSGIQQGGGKNFDYFLELKNVSTALLYVDIKFSDSEKFGHGTRIYSPEQDGVKIKPGKSQTLRIGTGILNNFSVASVTVQVDKEKEGKKPTISIVNCREKK